jgi:endonuclease YncB( thermonuclease family)
MQRLTRGKRLACTMDGSKTDNRCVAVCWLPNGHDIGARVIAAGLARDCPRYSQGRYASVETARSRTRAWSPLAAVRSISSSPARRTSRR